MSSRIKKINTPVLALKSGSGWRDAPNQPEIFHALDHPLRRRIYDILDAGPLALSELVRSLEKSLGTRIDTSRVLHHIRILERTGLIATREIPKGNARRRMILRRLDLRVQVYERPEPPM
jgi:DNA-binding transcriptional ArsR family regulator